MIEITERDRLLDRLEASMGCEIHTPYMDRGPECVVHKASPRDGRCSRAVEMFDRVAPIVSPMWFDPDDLAEAISSRLYPYDPDEPRGEERLVESLADRVIEFLRGDLYDELRKREFQRQCYEAQKSHTLTEFEKRKEKQHEQ